MKLNLGSCDRQFDGYESVDIVEPADWIVDLSKQWPWHDSSIDEVLALDIIEHIASHIHFMNELHRVLKPGARATIETPDASRGPGYFQDPTHKSPWTLNSFQYYEHGRFAVDRLAKSYGITARFKVIELGRREVPDVMEPVWKIRVVLQAVK